MSLRATQSQRWMEIKEVSGLESFIDTYDVVVNGNADPSEGIIVIL